MSLVHPAFVWYHNNHTWLKFLSDGMDMAYPCSDGLVTNVHFFCVITVHSQRGKDCS